MLHLLVMDLLMNHVAVHTKRRKKFLATLDTSIVPENTNLYYTNARADARIAAASIDDLSDVDTTGVISGSVLKWSGSAWVVGTDSPGATVDDATALAIALG